jgi:hypothetical protein
MLLTSPKKRKDNKNKFKSAKKFRNIYIRDAMHITGTKVGSNI